MMNYLWLVPFLPFLGFLILFLFGGFFSTKTVNIVGVGTIALSALTTFLIGVEFLQTATPQQAFVLTLWNWIQVGSFSPNFALHLDSLSLVMTFVVTFVGALIAFYSSEFMEEYGEERRFFAAMNLFITAMLFLVLADNYLLMYLGWEGVGLCSYLLIGFWYKDPANGRAARKAFIVTRVGDTFFAIGLFMIFKELGTLNIQEVLRLAQLNWPVGSTIAVTTALLLLGGAVGKSAQLPLQTWLPDAMVGPTPVSALIHAATMVTAGVYLIARSHVIFDLAPFAQSVVVLVGTLTLLMAGLSALNQRDIKKVLAYSTISQIGYMFLALGVGAYTSAMFHFMTHAFFKALLFLGAGVVSYCFHHQYDMFKLGGIRKQVPVLFWTFLIGSFSLAALPLISSGFFSKDAILWDVWVSPRGGPVFWVAGVLGAFITSLYTFRMIFLTFFGEARKKAEKLPGLRMAVPLIILAVLAVISGWLETPHNLGHITVFSHWIQGILPLSPSQNFGENFHPKTEAILQLIAVTITFAGFFLAYQIYYKRQVKENCAQTNSPMATMARIWLKGWGFDDLYHFLFVRPYAWLAQLWRKDWVDLIPRLLGEIVVMAHNLISFSQTGRVRHYAAGIAVGTIIILGMVVVS